jgi:hypothetical protein
MVYFETLRIDKVLRILRLNFVLKMRLLRCARNDRLWCWGVMILKKNINVLMRIF